MMMKPPKALPGKQQGAVLFIALIMLIVVTFLALSSMREVTLESRITGNMVEQKKLLSAAESGLRKGESSLLKNTNTSPEMCPNSGKLCINAYLTTPTANDIYANFSTSFPYTPTGGANTLDRNTRWYIRRLDAGGLSGEAEDPEYGNAGSLVGGKHYFEVNSQSTKNSTANDCPGDVTCIRSVITRLFL